MSLRPAIGVPGSSPRVWGILRRGAVRRHHVRFIPTRVGNTSTAPAGDAWHSVHPHACGEYCRLILESMCHPGSSPRVWGILHLARRGLFAPRFIPTRVGNTGCTVLGPKTMSVHPHACGEYSQRPARPRPCDGSSPRVWGIRNANALFGKFARFIPTRVGNTRRMPGVLGRDAVHPHACGEYACRAAAEAGCRGSSPRVWGIRDEPCSKAYHFRFIPTRVGNTVGPLESPA